MRPSSASLAPYPLVYRVCVCVCLQTLMNAVSLLTYVNLKARVRTCLVVTAVSVLVDTSRTQVAHLARTSMSVAMNRRVSMDVSTCLEDTAASVPSALYSTSTGTSALVSITLLPVITVVVVTAVMPFYSCVTFSLCWIPVLASRTHRTDMLHEAKARAVQNTSVAVRS